MIEFQIGDYVEINTLWNSPCGKICNIYTMREKIAEYSKLKEFITIWANEIGVSEEDILDSYICDIKFNSPLFCNGVSRTFISYPSIGLKLVFPNRITQYVSKKDKQAYNDWWELLSDSYAWNDINVEFNGSNLILSQVSCPESKVFFDADKV